MNWNRSSWNRCVRQAHRWLSIVFTLAVMTNIALNVLPLASDELVMWVGALTLLPLTLLLMTGLYLFLLPYANGGTSYPRTDA